MRNGLIFLFVLLIAGPTNAQFRKYSNEFLATGIGARAAGMGSAVVAASDDATAAYWNPAGLLSVDQKYQLALMHNEQFASIVRHDYGTLAYRPDDQTAFAFTVIRMGTDDILNTLSLFQNGQIDYSRISTFSAVDYAFIGSYARATRIPGLHVGANVKLIRRIIGDFAGAWGFGFDLGARYNFNGYVLAATVRDVTNTFNVWSYSLTPDEKAVFDSTGNKLPSSTLELTAPVPTLGISRKWEFFNHRFSVQPEADLVLSFDGKQNVVVRSPWFNVDPRLGLELGYNDMVFIRGGMMNLQRITSIGAADSWNARFSVGAGIRFHRITIDYALANPVNASTLPYSNVISVRVGFDGKG